MNVLSHHRYQGLADTTRMWGEQSWDCRWQQQQQQVFTMDGFWQGLHRKLCGVCYTWQCPDDGQVRTKIQPACSSPSPALWHTKATAWGKGSLLSCQKVGPFVKLYTQRMHSPKGCPFFGATQRKRHLFLIFTKASYRLVGGPEP